MTKTATGNTDGGAFKPTESLQRAIRRYEPTYWHPARHAEGDVVLVNFWKKTEMPEGFYSDGQPVTP